LLEAEEEWVTTVLDTVSLFSLNPTLRVRTPPITSLLLADIMLMIVTMMLMMMMMMILMIILMAMVVQSSFRDRVYGLLRGAQDEFVPACVKFLTHSIEPSRSSAQSVRFTPLQSVTQSLPIIYKSSLSLSLRLRLSLSLSLSLSLRLSVQLILLVVVLIVICCVWLCLVCRQWRAFAVG